MALVWARIAWLTACPESSEPIAARTARTAAVIAEMVISLCLGPVLVAVMMFLGRLLDPFLGLGSFVHRSCLPGNHDDPEFVQRASSLGGKRPCGNTDDRVAALRRACRG